MSERLWNVCGTFLLYCFDITNNKYYWVSAVTQFHIKGVWRSGRLVDCNPEGRGIESRWSYFWWFICRKVDGKLSENSFMGEQKTVGKFRWFRNIPSSSSELVGLTRSSCRNSFPSPLQVSLLHPVRLAKFSVNFFFSVESKQCEALVDIFIRYPELPTKSSWLPPYDPRLPKVMVIRQIWTWSCIEFWTLFKKPR